MLLGKDEASRVLKHLSEQEAVGISREIARLKKLSAREGTKILEEFGYLLKTRDLVARGGIEKAREILYAAFGEEKGKTIMENIAAKTAPHPFTFLMDLDVEQVLLLLKNESVPVIAVICSHLSPKLSARILTALPAEKQKEVAARIARLDKINPEVLRRAEEALKEKVRTQGEIITQEIDGIAVLVDILQNIDPAAETAILAKLKSQDRELSDKIEKKLFTPDILLSLTDRDLQAILREHSDAELALIMKGLNDRQRERITGNISSRRRELIEAEIEALGAVFRSEINKAVREFLDYILLQEEKGAITIHRSEDHLVL